LHQSWDEYALFHVEDWCKTEEFWGGVFGDWSDEVRYREWCPLAEWESCVLTQSVWTLKRSAVHSWMFPKFSVLDHNTLSKCVLSYSYTEYASAPKKQQANKGWRNNFLFYFSLF
jgi:hypothetical protein